MQIVVLSCFPYRRQYVDQCKYPLVLRGVGGVVLQYKGHYCELLHVRWQNVDALLLRYKK